MPANLWRADDTFITADGVNWTADGWFQGNSVIGVAPIRLGQDSGIVLGEESKIVLGQDSVNQLGGT